jgi:predicted PurR-regulated permease PerM
MKRLAWFTIVMLATFTLALLFWEFRVAVILFVLSLVVAATVRPLVDRFAARGLPRGLALLFTYAVCVGGVIVLVLILSGPLLADLQQLTENVADGYEQMRTQWPIGSPFQQALAQQLPSTADLYQLFTGALPQTVLGITLGAFDLLGQLLIVLVLSIYWSADQEHFKRLWLSLLPFERRARARLIWQTLESGLGAYLRSQVIQTVLAVILLGLGYQVLGLRYPVALALIGAIGWLIPWVGILLAVIPALWVGLSSSLALGLVAAAFTIGVLCFLEFVVEPRLFNRRRFSSLLVVIAVLVLVDEYGLIGILLAPPLAAAIQILAGQLMRPTPTAKTTLAQPISVLQTHLVSVQSLLATQTVPPGPELSNLVDRLTQLIARVDQEER